VVSPAEQTVSLRLTAAGVSPATSCHCAHFMPPRGQPSRRAPLVESMALLMSTKLRIPGGECSRMQKPASYSWKLQSYLRRPVTLRPNGRYGPFSTGSQVQSHRCRGCLSGAWASTFQKSRTLGENLPAAHRAPCSLHLVIILCACLL